VFGSKTQYLALVSVLDYKIVLVQKEYCAHRIWIERSCH
jgi:hypothetical protein